MKRKVDQIKGFFVCDQCRTICHDGEDDQGRYGPRNCPVVYPDRKKEIGCLGKFCDAPCELRKEGTDLTLDIAVDLISYLTIEINKLLIMDKVQKEGQ